jgi:hypothetical protein
MLRHRTLLCIAVALAALTGCTKSQIIEIWNNTVVPVVVVIGNERLSIGPGGKGKISPWLKEGEQLTIEASGTKSTFVFRNPPGTFLVETRTKTLLRLQLNADGFIYVLAPEAKGIIKQGISEQPTDFPLKPNAANASL